MILFIYLFQDISIGLPSQDWEGDWLETLQMLSLVTNTSKKFHHWAVYNCNFTDPALL